MSASHFIRKKSRAGVFLLEVMIAVAIFALGVLSVGGSIFNCIQAQKINNENIRATQALENKMAEIIADISLPPQKSTAYLNGAFQGLIMHTQRKTLDLKNEQNVNLHGLYQVDLVVQWVSTGSVHSKAISFFLLRIGV